MKNRWELYDKLIEGVPSDLTVREVICSKCRIMVSTYDGCGTAMTVLDHVFPSQRSGSLEGKSLRDAAALIKSWNLTDASIGLAAMNAWYNTREHMNLVRPGWWDNPGTDRMQEDAFECYRNQVKGMKVAAIGHFAYLERRYRGLCELSILEREQQTGDYPDTACEYLLEDQDFVFITGTTLVNKSLPRLLELSTGPVSILCGPSTVMAESLFEYGVDDLAGFVVDDAASCREAMLRDEAAGQEGNNAGIFANGRMVRLRRNTGIREC